MHPIDPPSIPGEDALRTLVDGIVDYAIFTLDPSGRVLTWNEGARRIKGYATEEIVGQHFSRFYTEEDRAAGKPERELAEAAARGRVEDEGWRVRKDGSRFWANVVVTALRSPDGRLRGFAKVTRDLTAQRAEGETRQQLRVEQAARAAAEAARRDAEAAHDRASRLQALAALLSGALTPEAVARAVAQQGVGYLGAYGALFYVLDPAAARLRLRGASGLADEVTARVAEVDPAAETATSVAARTGQPLLLGSPAAFDARFPGLAPALRLTGARALAALPLARGGRTLGVLTLAFAEPQPFGEADRRFLEVLGQYASQALDRALLYDDLLAERRKLEAVLEQMPSGLAIVEAPSGRVLLTNAQSEQIFGARTPVRELASHAGYAAYSAVGQPLADGAWPLTRALEQGEVVRGEILEVHGPGRPPVVVRTNAAPVRDPAGRVVAAVVTYDDVTEEVRAREEARRGAERLRFLAEASALLGSSLDYQATLKAVAAAVVPRLADWCGVEILDEAGRPEQLAVAHVDPSKVRLAWELRQRFPPDPDDPNNALFQVLRTGRPVLMREVSPELVEASVRDPEQRRITLELGLRSALVVAIQARGKVLGAITLVSAESGRRFDEGDLTLAEELAARAGIAIENAALYQQAQEAVRKRDEFLAVASHELKTPLTTLQLQATGIRRAAERGKAEQLTPERLRERALKVEAQVGRLDRLIGQLLDVGRLSEGRLALERERLDLAALAKEVCARFEEVAAEAGTPLTVSAPAPAWGRWDRSRLDQVLTNLVTNALKYGGGRPVRVEVETLPGAARLRVVDQGLGIAPADQERIFGRFERASAALKYGGIGLGLWIVRQLVELHGGRVLVLSEPGKGATFEVTLPAEG